MSKKHRTLSWISQIVAAVILGQTLFFKFSGAEEAVALFTKLGAEPYGRIGTGVIELITVVLLLVPRTAALGGAVTVGLMAGAVASHLGPIGIEVNGDGGALFVMGLVTLAAGTIITILRRAELPVVGARFRSARNATVEG